MSENSRNEFAKTLSAYVDGELSPEERQAVEARIAADPVSASQVADFRAAAGLIRLTLESQADEVDFKDFANQVMARITPQKLPFFERLQLSLSELFTYKRPAMVTSLVAASIAALIAVPVAFKLGGRDSGYAADRLEVQTVSVEQDSNVAPVIMKTDNGDTLIWTVDTGGNVAGDDKDKDKDKKKKKKKKGGGGGGGDDEEGEEELNMGPSDAPVAQDPKAGEL
jgi:anti-sigma factor RsiW